MSTLASPLTAARAYFDPAPGSIYLDAATYGLPPRPTVAALEYALRTWQDGTAAWARDWEPAGDRSRALFAQLIGCREDEIALVPTASVGVGVVAANLAPGSEVLLPEDEFTSVSYPLIVAEREHGIHLRRVPFTQLAEAITAETGIVAFSLTRSQDGESAALGDIVAAAQENGAQVLVDATHGIPFVPVTPYLDGIDYLVCHGYKHLLCPRGVGFLRVRQDHWQTLPPWLANWRSAVPQQSFGGAYSDLAPDARRFDVSLAWHAWVGAEQSLALLLGWQADGALDDVRAMARQLAGGLGRPDPSGSIVSLRVGDAVAAEAALQAQGIRCAARGSNVRLAVHVWNTEEEIARTIEVLQSVM
ncbi:MAG: aminotransferase class V-fold PLP-dependent enzyme [Thermomicrobiales bacterium]|nr:aminotransferase class V-fold PLP-dependent enzyme [Thermomicrobiales bacterium]